MVDQDTTSVTVVIEAYVHGIFSPVFKSLQEQQTKCCVWKGKVGSQTDHDGAKQFREWEHRDLREFQGSEQGESLLSVSVHLDMNQKTCGMDISDFFFVWMKIPQLWL